MKIKKVELQAFKSYLHKKDATFDFTLPDGTTANLVCIYAPNGFGKTSFYDAVDYGITRNITRYIRNQSTRVFNSKIADAIGKFSKQQETPQSQYVLRNRSAPDNVNTTISIETTVENFFEKIDRPRKNSKDYQFDESNTPEDRAFFREVMLSQEAIDSFLREDKAELRYSQFMEFQPTKVRLIESERQIITRLLSDIGKKEKELDKEIRALEDKIDSFTISDETREKANSIYESLIKKGYDIPGIKEEFDELQKNEKQLLVGLEKSKIEKELEQLEQEAVIISDHRKNLEISFEKFKKQIQISESISRAEERIELIGRYSKYNDDLTKVNQEYKNQFHKCETIFSKISVFNKFESIIKDQEESKRVTSDLEIVLNQSIQNRNKIESSKHLLSEQLLSNTESLQKINKSISNIDITYKSIEEHTQLLNAYILRKEKVEKSIINNESKIRVADDTISKLNNIKFTDESWMRQSCLSYEEVNIDLLFLESKVKDRRRLELEIVAIDSLLSKFINRGDNLSRLIDDSLNFISFDENKELTQCPVCSTDHHTHDKLCEAIGSNSLLEDKEKELQTKKSKLLSQIQEISIEYEQSRKGAQLYTESKLRDVETNKISLSNEKMALDKDLMSLNSMIHKSEDIIDRLRKETRSLDKSSLFDLYQGEISSKKNSNVIISEKIIQLDAELNEIENRIEAIRLELSNNTENEDDAKFYIEYISFLSDMGIDISTLNSNEAVKKISVSLDSKILTFNQKLDSLGLEQERLKCNIEDIESTIDGLTNERVKLVKELERNSLSRLQENYTHLGAENKRFIDFCLVNELKDTLYDKSFFELNNAVETMFKDISHKILSIKQGLSEMAIFDELIQELYAMFAKTRLSTELSQLNLRFTRMSFLKESLENDLEKITSTLKSLVDGYFYKDLINRIYEKVDPHPEFKEIKFECSFPDSANPQLNVFVQKEESSDFISPNLSFSSAQISVLSLSIFLARAINNGGYKNEPCECIFIDDPIQSMDSINILSTIDLLRNVSLNLDRQIVISTHDENFFELMKVKLPSGQSKFFSLVSYGRVEESLAD
ncbi:AAA family ATPase [Vibrio sp. TBV020]|uniref:AAA family ATPase n=1 Tax=Vibrio sp. TBV020 TaxID=3137398 RepID=UPI0038CD489F